MAVAEAQISAESIPSAGAPARAVSAGDGRFQLPLAPGRYRVTISRDSFAPAEQEIAIAAGDTRELQVRLSLEPLSSKVVVTAQALPLEAESSPAPLTIVTREQIDQRVATSLPDLLATQPGFSLGRTGPEGGQTSLFLDGGNSNYTKVLIDGVPANIPGGLIDFSNLTLDNVDKIEVVHGAESALYGSDAMDGVIQIFTHRGTTRVPEFTAFRGRRQLLHGPRRARSYPACWGDSITRPQSPISKLRARDPTTPFATDRYPEISAGAFPIRRASAWPCATTTAMRARPGRHFSSQPTSPTRLRSTISARACTRTLQRARTGIIS